MCWLHRFLHRVEWLYRDTCDADDSRIRDLYNQYDEESKGYLTLVDFLQFYKDACERKPRVVWTNLHSKHIRNDLTPMHDHDVRPEELARTYLANHSRFIDTISLYQSDPRVYYLLCRIPNGGQKIVLSPEEQWYWKYTGGELEKIEDPCEGIQERVYEVLE